MDYQSEFIRSFNKFSGKHRRDQVFSDFVIMASASLHNAVAPSDELEDEYMQVVKKYDRAELEKFAELLAFVVNGLEQRVCDFLGELYMSLELGNARAGQFFTPWHISKMMAMISYGGELASMDKEFITLSDPACGAGCMPIAFVEVMREAGHNPQQKLWVQCWDIDSTTARMCFIQLALLHIPAEIVIGNSLTMEVRRVMRTPAHHLGFWSSRLKAHQFDDAGRELLSLTDNDSSSKVVDDGPVTALAKPSVVSEKGQFELFN